MTPHRRRCLINVILEIKGALTVTDKHGAVTLLTSEKLLAMSDDEVWALYDTIAKSLEGALITEPAAGPLLEDVGTIVMEAIDEPGD